MSVMDDPRLLLRCTSRWTLGLTAIGVVASVLAGAWQLGVGLVLGVSALAQAVGFFVLLTRLFKPETHPMFPRLLILGNPLKYPLLMLFAYLAVRGGELMILGFVGGVVLPLGVLTAIAVREALRGDQKPTA